MQLTLEKLSKFYRDADRSLTVLDNVSYTFPESGTVAIVGRSGIGKSTLLHVVAGLELPSSGRVLFGPTVISDLSSEERASFRALNVGFIFQFHHLLPEFSAVENVAMPLIIVGVSDDIARREAEKLLEQMGLSHRMNHLPSQLSGGEQQRVAIARALISKPKVVVADEPTGNLDVESAAAVQRLLLDMNRELKSLLIVVTHSYELARSMDIVLEMVPGGALVPRDTNLERNGAGSNVGVAHDR